MDQDVNVHRVLKAHVGTIKALMDRFDGKATQPPDGSFATDDCGFGRWLTRLPPHFQALPEYRRCRDLHDAFHRHVDDVLDLLDRGDRNGALRLIGPCQAFSQTSRALILAFDDLNDRIVETSPTAD
jgi:hypothetical protein